MADEKTAEELEQEERTRNIRIAVGLLEKNCRDYCVGFTTFEADWFHEASSKTYGLGAARRLAIELEDQTRKDLE